MSGTDDKSKRRGPRTTLKPAPQRGGAAARLVSGGGKPGDSAESDSPFPRVEDVSGRPATLGEGDEKLIPLPPVPAPQSASETKQAPTTPRPPTPRPQPVIPPPAIPAAPAIPVASAKPAAPAKPPMMMGRPEENNTVEPTGPRPAVRGAAPQQKSSTQKARRIIELVLPGGVLRVVGRVLDSDEGGISLLVEPAPINPAELIDALAKVVDPEAHEPIGAGSREMYEGAEVVAGAGSRPLAPLEDRNPALDSGEHQPPPLPDDDDDIPEVEEDIPLPPVAPRRAQGRAARRSRAKTGPFQGADGDGVVAQPPAAHWRGPSSTPVASDSRDEASAAGSLLTESKAERALPPIKPVVVEELPVLPATEQDRLPPPRARGRRAPTGPVDPPSSADPGGPGLSRRRERRLGPLVGIDFGTSTSSVGLYRAGLELIEGDAGEVLVPSVVSFPRAGEVLIGEEARRRMGGEAQWTVVSPKRLLGRAYRDPQVGSLVGSLALRTFAGTDQLVRFEAHGEIYSAADVCALILGKLRERACRHLGADVTRAVFTVPVAFGSLQRSALERAAKQAGLQVEAMLTEPSAALLAHGFRGVSGVVAVYDFGGGTFDFCVVKVSESAFSVLCAGGDPWLGGDDFDNELAKTVADRFWKDSGVDLRTRAVEWQGLVFACERAKRELSQKSSSVVELHEALHTQSGSRGLRYKVSRRQLVKLCTPLVERSLRVVHQVMGQAGLQREHVDAVVMTGGSSMIPAVRAAVKRYFRKEPIAGDTELAVVRGAALRAADLSGQRTKETSTGGRELREVAGRTIGAQGEGGQLVTLFERDTPVPAKRKKVFHTVRDGQGEMVVALFEASKSRVDQQEIIGQLRYRGLPPLPAGEVSVPLIFELDRDGLLHVHATVAGQEIKKIVKLG